MIILIMMTTTTVIIMIIKRTMAVTREFHHIQVHANLLCIDLAFCDFEWPTTARDDPVRVMMLPKIPQTMWSAVCGATVTGGLSLISRP